MPIALVVIGVLMIVVGARGTHKEFGQLLVGDFTGPRNFTFWLAAMGIVGAIGYNEKLRPFSRMFLVLIIVGMIVRNGGFFDKLNEALQQGPATINPKPDPNASRAANDNGVGDAVKTATNFASSVASFAAKAMVFV